MDFQDEFQFRDFGNTSQSTVDEEFFDQGAGIEMIARDEKEFAAEKIFIQADLMNSSAMSSLSDGWNVHPSHATLSPLSLLSQSADSDGKLRLSCESYMTLMGARRGGSLGAPLDELDNSAIDIKRPYFGNEIFSPVRVPSNDQLNLTMKNATVSDCFELDTTLNEDKGVQRNTDLCPPASDMFDNMFSSNSLSQSRKQIEDDDFSWSYNEPQKTFTQSTDNRFKQTYGYENSQKLSREEWQNEVNRHEKKLDDAGDDYKPGEGSLKLIERHYNAYDSANERDRDAEDHVLQMPDVRGWLRLSDMEKYCSDSGANADLIPNVESWMGQLPDVHLPDMQSWMRNQEHLSYIDLPEEGTWEGGRVQPMRRQMRSGFMLTLSDIEERSRESYASSLVDVRSARSTPRNSINQSNSLYQSSKVDGSKLSNSQTSSVVDLDASSHTPRKKFESIHRTVFQPSVGIVGLREILDDELQLQRAIENCDPNVNIIKNDQNVVRTNHSTHSSNPSEIFELDNRLSENNSVAKYNSLNVRNTSEQSISKPPVTKSHEAETAFNTPIISASSRIRDNKENAPMKSQDQRFGKELNEKNSSIRTTRKRSPLADRNSKENEMVSAGSTTVSIPSTEFIRPPTTATFNQQASVSNLSSGISEIRSNIANDLLRRDNIPRVLSQTAQSDRELMSNKNYCADNTNTVAQRSVSVSEADQSHVLGQTSLKGDLPPSYDDPINTRFRNKLIKDVIQSTDDSASLWKSPRQSMRCRGLTSSISDCSLESSDRTVYNKICNKGSKPFQNNTDKLSLRNENSAKRTTQNINEKPLMVSVSNDEKKFEDKTSYEFACDDNSSIFIPCSDDTNIAYDTMSSTPIRPSGARKMRKSRNDKVDELDSKLSSACSCSFVSIDSCRPLPDAIKQISAAVCSRPKGVDVGVQTLRTVSSSSSNGTVLLDHFAPITTSESSIEVKAADKKKSKRSSQSPVNPRKNSPTSNSSVTLDYSTAAVKSKNACTSTQTCFSTSPIRNIGNTKKRALNSGFTSSSQTPQPGSSSASTSVFNAGFNSGGFTSQTVSSGFDTGGSSNNAGFITTGSIGTSSLSEGRIDTDTKQTLIADSTCMSTDLSRLLKDGEIRVDKKRAQSLSAINGDNSSPSKRGPSLVVPHEVRIPDICCVGLSSTGFFTVSNVTDRWLSVHFELSDITVGQTAHSGEWSYGKSRVGGRRSDGQVVCPFIVKPKAILEPKTTEEIKVIFVPRIPGVFVAELILHSAPVGSKKGHLDPGGSSGRLPLRVTLQAISEQPNIEMHFFKFLDSVVRTDFNYNMKRNLDEGSGDSKFIDFGGVEWGTCTSQRLTIVNKGRACVPLRLVISSTMSRNCFSFDKLPSKDPPLYDSGNKSVDSNSSLYCCTLPSVGPDGRLFPIDVAVYFKAPSRSTGPYAHAAVKFGCSVIAEIDTLVATVALARLELVAKAGTIKIHTPIEMKSLEFATQKSIKVPVRNAGSLQATVKFGLSHWQPLFSVVPNNMILEPGEDKVVVVSYRPRRGFDRLVESMLTLTVLPYGPLYNIKLIGLQSVAARDTLDSLPAEELKGVGTKQVHPTEALRDRWGKPVPKTPHGEQVPNDGSYFIDDSIANDVVNRDYMYGCDDVEATMDTLYVTQEPEIDGLQRGRFLNQTIPTTDRNKEDVELDMEKNAPRNVGRTGESLSDWLKLHNNRPDYGRKPSSPNPSLFSLSSHDREPFIYKSSQLVQTDSLQKNPSSNRDSLPKETTSAESLKLISKEKNLFPATEIAVVNNSGLSKCIAGPAQECVNIERTLANDKDDSARKYPYKDIIVSNAALDHPWIVQPDNLNWNSTDDIHSKSKAVKIVNLSDNILPFEVLRTSFDITIAPMFGYVPARRQVDLFVTPTHPLPSLPWSGKFSVRCKEQSKDINVQIQSDVLKALFPPNEIGGSMFIPQRPAIEQIKVMSENQTRDVTPPTRIVLQDTLSLQPLCTLALLDSTSTVKQKLCFPSTSTSTVSQMYFELKNVSSTAVHWRATPFTEAYRKIAGDQSCTRLNQSVFWLSSDSGILRPATFIKISACFSPHDAGSHSQHWQINCFADNHMEEVSRSCKIELIGEASSEVIGKNMQCIVPKSITKQVGPSLSAVQDLSADCRPPDDLQTPRCKKSSQLMASHNLTPNLPPSPSTLVWCHGLVTIRPLLMTFKSCPVNGSETGKLELKNKDSQIHVVEVLNKLTGAFSIRHTQLVLRVHHFLRMPVEFHPKTKGHHDGFIKLALDGNTNDCLTVRLSGECS